jgi:integrase
MKLTGTKSSHKRVGKTIDRLTERELPTLKAGQHQDGGGLSLQVTDKGQRSWVFRFVNPDTGKPTNRGLGSLETTSLLDARKARNDARDLLKRGTNPFPANTDGTIAMRNGVPLFLPYARQVMAVQTQNFKGENTKAKWALSIETYAAPLHDKQLNEIKTADIASLLSPIWLTKETTARELRRRLEKVFSAAIADEIIERNPAALKDNLEHKLPKQKNDVKSRPFMPQAEIPAFMVSLRERGSLSSSALRFLILTCGRASEVAQAEWSEFDLEGKVWTIAGKRMKNGLECRTPLTDEAVAILKDIREMGLSDQFVFPGDEDGHISDGTLLGLLQRGMDRPDCTVHGFRSSFRTWGQEDTSIEGDILEYCLHHIEGSRTEAAYKRGECLDKRRAALEAWTAFATTPPKKSPAKKLQLVA